MLTTFEPILQFLKPHISKSKACFEKFVKKSFRWHLETWQNEIVSIFKLNIKKYREMKLILPGGGVQVALLPGGWGSGMVQKCFCHLTQFFDIQRILPISFCWVSRCHLKDFFHKFFKTGLNFWNMWLWELQNLVPSCQHIGGTPCIWYRACF